ncbi:MAG: ATP-binding protein [Bryobacteraceae bacterium]|nr:ATP-binding protein [Bryobacteraceae bacterium]MDW8378709.1 ATP-binding protein [Bryobacterales bacterium]
MKELKTQLINALLVVLTVAAVIAAGINFQQQSRYRLPDDGVSWVDRTIPKGGARAPGEAGSLQRQVVASIVSPDGPGARAGIKPGDVVLRINGSLIESANAVPQVLARLGAWSKAEYLLLRDSVEFKVNVYVAEGVPEPAVYYQYIVGLSYLLIGIFVFVRRGNAAKALHFYVLCLTSFVASCFHYTGKLNNFDKIIYWGNLGAGLLAPTIFLHFCLSFPERREWLRGKRILLLYLPAALILTIFVLVASGSLVTSFSLPDLRWMLDRIWTFAYGFLYLLGALALALEYRRTEDPIVRQQLKWLRNGVVFAMLPFTCFYLLPYAMGHIPGPWAKMAVLALPLMPLTWAYAIIRYRLMDVDIIFQQGYAYTLATLAVIGLFYILILSYGNYLEITPSALVVMILVATFVFHPIRNWIQEQLDRYIYKDRYDYRRTLIEFGRELSAETDLQHLLTSVIDRLRRTLSVPHVACFLFDENANRFYLAASNRPLDPLTRQRLDLSFLDPSSKEPYLFFERTRNLFDVVSQEWPQSVRLTIADLDLTYYIPCTVRGRKIAYLGLSRTDQGDFLSSEDIDLLTSLAGYLAIAVENARLYQSLERKMQEFERLKEFSENIVESINVGILAADLEDRVESWNSQIEKLTGIPRQAALGKKLDELLPADLCERLDAIRGESGIHNIYQYTLRPPSLPLSPAGRGAGLGANGTNGTNGTNGAKGAASSNGRRDTRFPSEYIVNLAVAPLVSKDGAQIGRLVIFDDITERSQLERQLIQADKLSSIGLLAAGVAHEVNTPLAVISSYAQMLAKQVSGDEAKAKLLDKIAKQTFRASEIVNSLLNFSRTSATDFDEVDLNKVLRETVSLIEHQFQKARIELILDLAEGLGPIRGNAGKLQQVFLNLLLNARDALENGGTIHIRSYVDGDLARVSVADNGPGIAPEHLEKIYDPFFTTKGAKKGTGLGLAVTYGIVKEHGGHIEVESRLGEGACFHLDFPLIRKTVNA